MLNLLKRLLKKPPQEAKAEREFNISTIEPLNKTEMQWAADVKSQPAWGKIRDHLEYYLVSCWLKGHMRGCPVTEELKQGFVIFGQKLDDLKVYVEEKGDEEVSEESTSMWIQDEE